MMNFWGQKTFCLITGASRGIGKTIAIEFSKKVAEGSLFVLVARSAEALESTKGSILQATENKCQAVTSTMDLERPNRDSYFNLVNSALVEKKCKPEDFDHYILVHNAGSLGNTKKKIVEMDDMEEIQSYFTLNLTSMILLNSQFFKVFKDAGSTKQRSVVQITSLAGVKPFKTWGYYCAGKACRDMLMKSLAVESGIQVLSWAPGPVDTEMYDGACKNTGDEDLSKMLNEGKDKGNILTAEQTVSKLVKVLSEKKYVLGEHVDYFDLE